MDLVEAWLMFFVSALQDLYRTVDLKYTIWINPKLALKTIEFFCCFFFLYLSLANANNVQESQQNETTKRSNNWTAQQQLHTSIRWSDSFRLFVVVYLIVVVFISFLFFLFCSFLSVVSQTEQTEPNKNDSMVVGLLVYWSVRSRQSVFFFFSSFSFLARTLQFCWPTFELYCML